MGTDQVATFALWVLVAGGTGLWAYVVVDEWLHRHRQPQYLDTDLPVDDPDTWLRLGMDPAAPIRFSYLPPVDADQLDLDIARTTFQPHLGLTVTLYLSVAPAAAEHPLLARVPVGTWWLIRVHYLAPRAYVTITPSPTRYG